MAFNQHNFKKQLVLLKVPQFREPISLDRKEIYSNLRKIHQETKSYKPQTECLYSRKAWATQDRIEAKHALGPYQQSEEYCYAVLAKQGHHVGTEEYKWTLFLHGVRQAHMS